MGLEHLQISAIDVTQSFPDFHCFFARFSTMYTLLNQDGSTVAGRKLRTSTTWIGHHWLHIFIHMFAFMSITLYKVPRDGAMKNMKQNNNWEIKRQNSRYQALVILIYSPLGVTLRRTRHGFHVPVIWTPRFTDMPRASGVKPGSHRFSRPLQCQGLAFMPAGTFANR